jgi:hypothetical protein
MSREKTPTHRSEEWFGHPAARRQKRPDGWFYEDNGNMAFAFVLAGAKGSMFLWDIDAFIEGLEAEGVGAGSELRERRTKAYEAFRRTGNNLFHDSCIRHIEWIMLRIREIKLWDKAGPLIEKGKDYGRVQSDRAKKKRVVLNEETGETLGDLIARLALRTDELGDDLPAQELWGEFYSALDAMQLDPDEAGPEEDRYIEYDFGAERRIMKFSSFKVSLSKERTKLERS